ncbi:MAG: PAS domain S-box protein [bacterium]|nr:PAS domain S-box protein [bacterium]
MADANRETAPEPNDLDGDLGAGYRGEIDRALRRGIDITAALFLLLVGISVVLERHYHPDRLEIALRAYAIELAACALAIAAARVKALPPAVPAAALGVTLGLLMQWYGGAIALAPERIALGQVCLTMGLFVLLPWPWRTQLVVSTTLLAGLVLHLLRGGLVETASFSLLAMLAATIVSVWGAWYLDRYRRNLHVRTALLARTSATNTAILEAALDAIVGMDHRGRLTEFNPAAERLFGRRRADVLGRDLADLLLPPVARAAHREGLARHLAGGTSTILGRRLETTALGADGQEVPIELTVSRVHRDGPPTFTATLRDITEQKRADAARRASKRQAEEEAETAAALLHVGETLNAHLNQPDLLERVTWMAVDALGCDWGSAFEWDERTNAFRLRGCVGLRLEVARDLGGTEFTPDTMHGLIDAVRRGILVEIADRDAQPYLAPESLARWEVSSKLVAPIRRGEVTIGLLCVGYRERRGPFSPRQRRLALGIAHATGIALANARLIADLQSASRLKSEFVSTMSHELRTPLNVILGFCEMARDAELPREERDACVARIDGAGRELLDLVESTLEIGRIEAGRDEARLETVRLPALWSELGQSCAGLPHGPTVALEWSPEVPPVSLTTDPRKLSIVLRNLVGNALKFTPRGRVAVAARLDGPALVIEVADTGIGIAPEQRETIFEMFRQADQSDSRRFGGTGLGLYIVRRFVEQMGGRVEVDSTPGAGSTFRVTLPQSASAPPLHHAA